MTHLETIDLLRAAIEPDAFSAARAAEELQRRGADETKRKALQFSVAHNRRVEVIIPTQ